MTESSILVERRSHATWITLNRPHVANALDTQAFTELRATLALAAAETEVRSVLAVLEGTPFVQAPT